MKISIRTRVNLIQRSLHSDIQKKEPWEQDALFRTRCTSHGKVCSVIVDSGSFTNIVSEEMLTKLGLTIEKHPKPYNFHWLQDGEGMKITYRCLVPFSIGKTYYDELWCDVMKMSTYHLLLGRPWMFDRCVQLDGYLKTYSFTKDGCKLFWNQCIPKSMPKDLSLNEWSWWWIVELVTMAVKGDLSFSP